jgi:hypothetical protein
MKIHFKLYTNGRSEYKSSIFDLVQGNKETKQTKLLAYILSQYEDFLFNFLNYDAVKREMVRCSERHLNSRLSLPSK